MVPASRPSTTMSAPDGAVIDGVGRTGNATTYHLHFEIRVDGVPVDRLPQAPGVVFTGYLDDVRPAVAGSRT